MRQHGWTLLFHDCFIAQLQALQAAVERAKQRNPAEFESNANVKLFRAITHLVMEVVPADPSRDEYRQGNTMGGDYRHWRRVKFGGRFRLFLRYDSNAKVIIYAWVNDDRTLRARGSQSDPYVVFKRMLDSGNPPDNWDALLKSAKDSWERVKS